MLTRSPKLLAVDPSLTCSGWALFNRPAGRLLGVGKIHSLPSSCYMAHRLRDVQQKVLNVLQRLSLGADDLLVCEGPTTVRDPRAALLVEQIRVIFETVARSRDIEVPGRLNPRSVQYEVLGLRGKQLARPIVKETAVQAVYRLHASQLEEIGFDSDLENLRRNQDVVDAILVGDLAMSRVGSAERAGGSLVERFDEKRLLRGYRARRTVREGERRQ